MNPDALVQELQATEWFFNNATAPLTAEHADFAPAEGMYTAAQQIAHVAFTVNWFHEGAFRPEGFDTDFALHDQQVRAVVSIEEARAALRSAFQSLIDRIAAAAPEDLAVPLPEGPIMGGMPRAAIIGGVVDHTAHHRGALAVYLRLLGIAPPMPYSDF